MKKRVIEHKSKAKFWPRAVVAGDQIYVATSGIGEDGQAVGQIHFLERPDREPVSIVTPRAGVLLGDRGPSVCAQGDCVAVIAHDIDPGILE